MTDKKKNKFDAMLRSGSSNQAVVPARPQDDPYPLSTRVVPVDLVELPPEAAQLGTAVQHIARQLITSKRRIGEEILKAGRLLDEARQLTEHGDWLLFLRVTNTSPDTAERLINIHTRAVQSTIFSDAIARGWLTESAAWRLARPSTPELVIQQVLALPEPPTVREVEAALVEAGIGTSKARKRGTEESQQDWDRREIPPHGGISERDGQPSQEHMPPHGGISGARQWDSEPDTLLAIEPLTAEMRRVVPDLIALVERYTAHPARLSAEDWALLAPLAAQLGDLLSRLNHDRM